MEPSQVYIRDIAEHVGKTVTQTHTSRPGGVPDQAE